MKKNIALFYDPYLKMRSQANLPNIILAGETHGAFLGGRKKLQKMAEVGEICLLSEGGEESHSPFIFSLEQNTFVHILGQIAACYYDVSQLTVWDARENSRGENYMFSLILATFIELSEIMHYQPKFCYSSTLNQPLLKMKKALLSKSKYKEWHEYWNVFTIMYKKYVTESLLTAESLASMILEESDKIKMWEHRIFLKTFFFTALRFVLQAFRKAYPDVNYPCAHNDCRKFTSYQLGFDFALLLRNEFMAQAIEKACMNPDVRRSGKPVVVVVGLGHLKGNRGKYQTKKTLQYLLKEKMPQSKITCLPVCDDTFDNLAAAIKKRTKTPLVQTTNIVINRCLLGRVYALFKRTRPNQTDSEKASVAREVIFLN